MQVNEKQVEQLNKEGVNFFLSGNFSEAKKKYLQALDMLPEFPSTLNNLGMIFLQEKNYPEAETYFLKAVQIKESSTYLLNLGHVYANMNKLEKAEEHYRKSIELDPSSLMAWKSLGSLYQFQQKYFQSVEVWENIIEYYSNAPDFKIELAKDLIMLNEYQQALNVLSLATGQEHHQEKVWYYTALIHFNQSNFGIALSSINTALAVKPDDEESRILVAAIHLALGETDKAMMHWNYLLNVNENNHRVRTDKAVTLLANGHHKEALTEFNFVITREENNIKALYYKALTLIEINEKLPEAKDILNMLKTGNHPFSEQAAELLKKLDYDK